MEPITNQQFADTLFDAAKKFGRCKDVHEYVGSGENLVALNRKYCSLKVDLNFGHKESRSPDKDVDISPHVNRRFIINTEESLGIDEPVLIRSIYIRATHPKKCDFTLDSCATLAFFDDTIDGDGFLDAKESLDSVWNQIICREKEGVSHCDIIPSKKPINNNYKLFQIKFVEKIQKKLDFIARAKEMRESK